MKFYEMRPAKVLRSDHRKEKEKSHMQQVQQQEQKEPETGTGSVEYLADHKFDRTIKTLQANILQHNQSKKLEIIAAQDC